MKRFYVLLLIVLFTFGVVWATGEYRSFNASASLVVITDVGDDSTTGSISLYPMNTMGFKSFHGQVVLGNAYPVLRGIGEADSGWIQIYTVDDAGNSYLLDSTSKAGLPCTLTTTLHSNVGDTLLRDMIRIDVQIEDTLGDSAFTATYPISWNIKLK